MSKLGPEDRQIPDGLRLRRTLPVDGGSVGRLAFSPDGELVAVPTDDGKVGIWSVSAGSVLRTLDCGDEVARVCAFDPRGETLAVGGKNGVSFFSTRDWSLRRRVQGPYSVVAFAARGDLMAIDSGGRTALTRLSTGQVLSVKRTRRRNEVVAFSPDGTLLAVVGLAGRLLVYNLRRNSAAVAENTDRLHAVTFSPDGRLIACAGGGGITLLHASSLRVVATLEGHTAVVSALAFDSQGDLLASRSQDGTTRLWHAGTLRPLLTIAGEPEPGGSPGVAFHPARPVLATTTRTAEGSRQIDIWDLDLDVLLGNPTPPAMQYTTAKIVLVGDTGVGKTGLGWRLSHGQFKEHASTHGQQFWLLHDLGTTRSDGAQCEAVLWDLAGQPDYRLIHALFVDDADLALVVIDPTREDDPLRTAEYWLRQLRVGEEGAPRVILVAARVDRGGMRLSEAEVQAFCRRRGLADVIMTSAVTGEGLDELMAAMRAAIDWEARPSTITTDVFKEIKDYVLGLKESDRRHRVILAPAELRNMLQRDGVAEGFTDAEMTTALGHMANHGYVTWLSGSGGQSLLLAPELINNLAASIVVEARRNPKGLGSLEEKPLLSGEYRFPELDGLSEAERGLLLDSAVAMFLSRNICFRSADPLSSRTYLVFPDLINLPRPSTEDEEPVEEVISYTVTGATENLYASLVVVLGYTNTFARTKQWRSHARYVVGNNLVCDLRAESEDTGEVTFGLSYGRDVPPTVRSLFQSLVENLLDRPDLTVRRYPLVSCEEGHRLDRTVMRKRLAEGFAFCPDCGRRLELPRPEQPADINTTPDEATWTNRRVADHRSRFEEVVFRLTTYVKQDPPSCFISYAWGDATQERWVEHLVEDLVKAGINVILDRWDLRPGANLARFIERVLEADRVVVVGTPAYRTKYVNNEPMRGFGVAAEGDLIGARMIGTEPQKASVLPVLLEGEAVNAFPPLLQNRVYVDFRDSETYFETVFDLMLSLYGLSPREPAIVGLGREIAGDLP